MSVKRTIEISEAAVHVTVRHEQLVLLREGAEIAHAPLEDLGALVVDQRSTTYSHAALVALAASGAAVALCGANHLPAAMVVPVADNGQLVARLRDQLAASRPVCKQIWRQIVRAKIRGQAGNLDQSLPAHRKLLDLATLVRSGDVNNAEATAARVYWRHWLKGEAGDTSFRRQYDGDGINSLLNYGYAIVRAAIARAIVAGGLLPSWGVQHHRRGNAFCLADDLIEPLRPVVDALVRTMCGRGVVELTRPAKGELLGLLAATVSIGDESGPLASMLTRYVASLCDCYAGRARRLAIPIPLVNQVTGAQ